MTKIAHIQEQPPLSKSSTTPGTSTAKKVDGHNAHCVASTPLMKNAVGHERRKPVKRRWQSHDHQPRGQNLLVDNDAADTAEGFRAFPPIFDAAASSVPRLRDGNATSAKAPTTPGAPSARAATAAVDDCDVGGAANADATVSGTPRVPSASADVGATADGCGGGCAVDAETTAWAASSRAAKGGGMGVSASVRAAGAGAPSAGGLGAASVRGDAGLGAVECAETAATGDTPAAGSGIDDFDDASAATTDGIGVIGTESVEFADVPAAGASGTEPGRDALAADVEDFGESCAETADGAGALGAASVACAGAPATGAPGTTSGRDALRADIDDFDEGCPATADVPGTIGAASAASADAPATGAPGTESGRSAPGASVDKDDGCAADTALEGKPLKAPSSRVEAGANARGCGVGVGAFDSRAAGPFGAKWDLAPELVAAGSGARCASIADALAGLVCSRILSALSTPSAACALLGERGTSATGGHAGTCRFTASCVDTSLAPDRAPAPAVCAVGACRTALHGAFAQATASSCMRSANMLAPTTPVLDGAAGLDDGDACRTPFLRARRGGASTNSSAPAAPESGDPCGITWEGNDAT
mmetsp:Transcript_31851/g.93170  ORF Transcript_31851/g.93170 Transcript_31851/m.93170 type:complete len:594 (-) Transcript_31851:903-2684(-)